MTIKRWTRSRAIRTRRAVVLTWLGVSIVCLANQFLGWGFFDGFEKSATAVSYAVLALLLYLFWVDPEESRAERARRR